MKKIIYTIIAALCVFATTSCSDMLKTDNDSMVIDPDLNNKTDSMFYALGIAQAMQQLADQYFYIGEMRGELATTTASTNTNLRSLANYSATTANKYDSAYVYYKVINNCNYYLAHRDTTLYTGSANVTLEEYAAVASWRAWAYLQLARTYCGNENKIPFFTEPLTSISAINEDNFPKKNLSEIVDALAPSLERFSGMSVPTYNNHNYEIGTTNWGVRKYISFSRLFVPVDIILGEMYLEQGLHYDKAASHFAKYLCDIASEADVHANPGLNKLIFNIEYIPDDFGSAFNGRRLGYKSIYSNSAEPTDVVTYIPMAVSAQRGQTTTVPMAFGYDYYSTSRANACPHADEIEIAPSTSYYAIADSTYCYYYTLHTSSAYTDGIAKVKFGDGRAQRINESDRIYTDDVVLLQDRTDTSKVYVEKVKNANIYLYRNTTVYLHLAEALNRMGYPELAFAILRNGISTYLEELVPSADAPQPYQYLNAQAIQVLQTTAPFLNATNRNKFAPEYSYGIHNRGAGYYNATGIENLVTVTGSRATTVGSERNLMYLPKPIIGEKLDQIAKTFPGITIGMTKADSINAMEDLLCDEYAMEFAFEGQRFYDLQRIARHKNESGLYGGNFGSVWFANKLAGNNPQVNLLEPKNWYLPFK